LIGDCRVGKTSYLNYVVNSQSLTKGKAIPPTIGVEYAPTKVSVRGQEVKI
jgi:GTPase SAR1 family protein